MIELEITDSYASRVLPSEVEVVLSGLAPAAVARRRRAERCRVARRRDRRRLAWRVLRRPARDVDAAQTLRLQVGPAL